MNYARYINCDDANGEGVRCSLFVSGCTHKCVGCFNKPAWKFSYGKEYTQDLEDKILSDLKNDYVSGLSLLGGEPMHHRNLPTVINLCKRVRKEIPDKGIWLWTGYTLSEIKEDPDKNKLMGLVDIVVDGKYEESLSNPELKWRGSSNQNLIQVREL